MLERHSKKENKRQEIDGGNNDCSKSSNPDRVPQRVTDGLRKNCMKNSENRTLRTNCSTALMLQDARNGLRQVLRKFVGSNPTNPLNNLETPNSSHIVSTSRAPQNLTHTTKGKKVVKILKQNIPISLPVKTLRKP